MKKYLIVALITASFALINWLEPHQKEKPVDLERLRSTGGL